MCGIIGYLGNNNAKDVIVQKLKTLEYRGYDSAGISLFNKNSTIDTIKVCGKIQNLQDKLKNNKNFYHCGIGHTRWATHGAPNEINSHPHLNQDSTISIVHNGIIENFEDLKKQLIKKGAYFKSDTDSEVIAHTLSLSKKRNNKEKMLSLLNILQGTFAILAIFQNEPNTLYALTHKSPLIIGKGKNEILFASDTTALIGNCNEIYRLQDNELIIAQNNSITLIKNYFINNKIDNNILQKYNKTTNELNHIENLNNYLIKNKQKINNPIVTNSKNNKFNKLPNLKKINNVFNYKEIEIDWQPLEERLEEIELNGFNTFMQKEIYEIPHALKKTYDYLNKNFNATNIFKDFDLDINSLHFIGCGTALHSGNIAKKYCDKLGIFSQTHYASEFRYAMPPLKKNDICVFISQSGETADTLEALKLAKSKSLTTIALTNNIHSSITKFADFILPIKAGKEISVASTKAYNCQILALLFFINKLINQKNMSLLQKIEETNQYKNNLNHKIINTKNAKTTEDYNFFNQNTQNQLLTSSECWKNFIDLIDLKNLESQTAKIAEIIKDSEHIFFIGKDFDYLTALEASLKLKEISYIHCEAFPSGELKHGTLALIDNKSVVIALATQSKLLDKTLNSLYEVKTRGAHTILISTQNIHNDAINNQIILPTTNEFLMPILSIIPCQLLALQTTLAKNLDPDKPRNLAKSVTVE